MIYQLRLAKTVEDCKEIMKLPIVCDGNYKIIKKYAENNGFLFKRDKKLLYQGYFVNTNGEVLYIT